MRLTAAAILSIFVVWVGSAGVASAQIPSKEQACIAAFNKGIRKVAKAQGKVVAKCLSQFASGKLASTTPENCVLSDPNSTVAKAAQRATDKINKKCANVTAPFGTSDVPTALSRAGLSQVEMIHETVGANLDLDLIATPNDATCQSKASSAVLRCIDRRVREYLKCQKISMRVGDAVDATSLTNTCLGTGGNSQPDPFALIANDCVTKVSNAVTQHCTGTNLLSAFGPCAPANDPAATAACLQERSACQLCLLLNDVDSLSRDCDLFDDGNATNGSCGSECGDGILQVGESCDDNNTNDNDGCSAHCTPEGGYTCTGQPSVCTLNCGNGALDAGEACDDSDTQNGDGCSSACLVESGYSCTGQPSVCTKNCGNGTLELANGEVCDDHNHNNGDGCSNTCQVEDGYSCVGTQPSVCTFVCGNGTFQSGESCDDGDAQSGDGCSSVCHIEAGWQCTGQPSVCFPICGDGLKRGSEPCDDGNTNSADGCSSTCQTETGFLCTGQPSHCTAICGDGFIRGFETCDDSNTNSGDGCSGDICRQEPAFSCGGQPSVCTLNCGDANLDNPEQCDDGNHINGDGCNANCLSEPGYVCAGQPSVCVATCGNGVLQGSEQCDDGNTISNDGCSASCTQESGYVCPTPGQQCITYDIVIDSPANGTFTTAGSVVVSGHYTVLTAGQGLVTINGVPAAAVNPIARTFTHTVVLNSSAVFNPIRATLTNLANGDTVHDRVVVINGPSVADGVHSPQSVALRINDSGLDVLEPLVSQLAVGQFDLGALLPSGTVLADECFISVIGCWGSARVTIGNPAPSFGSFSIGIDSKPNKVTADIRVNDLRVDVDIDGSGLVPDCGLRLTANQMQLIGDYSLEPKVGDLSNIDVNLIGSVAVNFAGFDHEFTYGLCDAPIIGDIIQAFLPDIEQFARDGISGFVNDPDGAGPQDSPIADAVETVLEGINITGPLGQGLGLMLDSPLFEVVEDNTGITFGSEARFSVSIGNGPGQCIPPLGTPNLTASYSPASTFPTFGANTPVGNQPYGFGICINTSGFNQLLRGQTECGLMRTSLTQIDLDGSGPNPPTALTSSLLSLIVPEFAQLPANTPMRIDIAPTIAPIVTGNPGPSGELTDLKIAQVMMSIVEVSNNRVWLRGALDARLGMNLDFLPDGSGLAIDLSPPLAGDLTIAIIYNPLHTNAAAVEAVLPSLVTPLIPDLAGALAGFPLPQFFGLNLSGVEVSKNGQFMSLFANLTPAP